MKIEEETETDLILSLFQGKHGTQALLIVARQINVTHTHGQSVVLIAGIVLAVTAQVIPQISILPLLARTATLIGSTLVLVSALFAVWGVFRPRWVTQFPRTDDKSLTRDAIRNAIRIRNTKSKFLYAAEIFLIIGLLAHAIGVVLYMGPW